MDSSITIGRYNSLLIKRESEHGYYLSALDESEVLLPNIYKTPSMKIGDELRVFIYTDSEDRVVATTQKPKAEVGDFTFLQVIDRSQDGFFLDWGLPKDLFVPKSEQKGIVIGESYLFYVALDDYTKRVYASQKIGKYLDTKVRLKKDQEVLILIFAKTPLGYKAIINNRYSGMIYHNEIYETIKLGDRKKAYVKKIRSDNQCDLTLQALGKGRDKFAKTKLLEALEKMGGVCQISSKSDPTLIRDLFSLSKKDFKRALQSLKEAKEIAIEEDTIKKIS